MSTQAETEMLNDPTPVSVGMLAQLMNTVGIATAKQMRKGIADAQAPLLQRISSLETKCGAMAMILGRDANGKQFDEVEALQKRIDELEARPTVQYKGIHQSGELYPPGTLVTHSGSMWFSWKPTYNKPGASDDWQLAVKNGDARGK